MNQPTNQILRKLRAIGLRYAAVAPDSGPLLAEFRKEDDPPDPHSSSRRRSARDVTNMRAIPAQEDTVLDLYEEFLGVVNAMDKAGISYAVCGGLAVAARGFPRATQDIDPLILPEQVAETVACLGTMGYRANAAPMVFNLEGEADAD